jgi:Fur family ferric uptake transcriptional regulator
MATTPKMKLTKRQELILDAFRNAKKPITAQEAWKEIGTEEVGLATVYRAIKLLIEHKLLRGVEIMGEIATYEATGTGHHHHFYCTECCKVYEVKKCVPKLEKLVPKGFQLTDHTITLYGLCSDCQQV